VKPEENMGRIRFVAVVVVLGASGLACHRGEPEAPPPRPVRLQRIASDVATGELRYSATVQPQAQVALAFKVGGYVREIARRRDGEGRPRLLQQGDVVPRGIVLARLDDADYAQRLARARAQRSGAAATLDRARADAGRAEELYASQSMTRVEYDAARASLAVATSNLAAADADLESAAIGVRDAVLRAPSDALVLSRGIEEGTLASPGTLAFSLADVSRMKAIFGVPERIARSLELGEELPLELESRSDPVRGRVTAISPSADARSRVFAVEVTLPNPERQIRAGTIAAVRVRAGGEPRAARATVPLGAVVRSHARADRYSVFVVVEEGGRRVARARDVELGPIAGNAVQVASGLDGIEQVVVAGASLLADGDRVSVVE
jgi:membrane fusion protein, multidrug efflux system